MFRITILFAASALSLHGQSATFRWIRQIGGSGGQTIAGTGTDPQGNIWVAGTTTSLDFPVQNAAQARPGGSGLFRVDGPGANWQNLYQAGVPAASAVAVDARNPRTVYAATATDVRRSTDSGANWTVMSKPQVQSINGMAADPANSGVLYLATSGQGILKSTDGGATWTAINGNLPQTAGTMPAARNIWVDPNNGSVLFVVAASNSYFLARSADGGSTWQVLQGTPVPINGALTFDPVIRGKVYAADGSQAAVSMDDGVTWTALASTGVTYSEPWVILTDPNHAGVLYGGGKDAVWKSTDNGSTWTRQITAPASLMAADPATGVIYAADKFGASVVMSSDFFQTAVPAGPAGAGQISGLAAGGGHLFASTLASSDVFVAKFDPQGNMISATYFGGFNTDTAKAMAVDAAGAVYVAGTTQSLDFPVTRGGYASTPGQAFLFKLNADGSLAWSTYLAGPPAALAVDAAGHVFVAGTIGASYGTTGQTLSFQTTPGAYQTKFDGTLCGPGCPISVPPTNGFVTELDPSGSFLVYSTYLGTQNEIATALAVLNDGSAVVAGQLALYHLDPTGSSLLAKKSFQGNVQWLTTDPAGNILAVGGTQYAQFQTTPGAFQTALYPALPLPGTVGNTGAGDAFVSRLDAQLNILNSTLLGGEAGDTAFSAAGADNGDVIVAGSTFSCGFPTHAAAQGPFTLGGTGFLTELSADFSSLTFSTFAGDTRPFYIRSVAIAPDGGILFGGSTSQAPYFTNDYLAPLDSSQAFLVRVETSSAALPRIDSVVSAASQLAVPLSPGGVVAVRGAGFGSDASVLLNGNALPLIEQSGTLLTATVPTDFSGNSATVEVDSGGGRATILVPGAPAAPGIFSTDGSGTGQGYILNKDGTTNSADNPAAEGDEITVFATGVGSMTFDHGYAVTDAPVYVLVDGFLAPGIAAVLGPAAGLPGNVYQISVYVPRPADLAASNPSLQGFVMPPMVAVTLKVNGVYSQAGLALHVKHE